MSHQSPTTPFRMKEAHLTDRLERGERWDGDNAEVLRAIAAGRGLHHMYPLDSVDAALALVPSGWFTADANQWSDTGHWTWPLDKGDDQPVTVEGTGPTAAIALVCAILRAQEAGRG